MEVLNNANEGDIIARGTMHDGGSTNLDNTGKQVSWLAVRGFVNDWAIYYRDLWDESIWTDYRIKSEGHKMPKDFISKLVNVDDEALSRYRV